MELKIGKKYRIKKFKTRPSNWNRNGKMDKWMGKIVSIQSINRNRVGICEDMGDQHAVNGWSWNITDFEEVEITLFTC